MGVILAASVVATVPVLFLFTFGVDKLVAGWGEGSLKGQKGFFVLPELRVNRADRGYL